MKQIIFSSLFFLLLRFNLHGLIVSNPSDPCLYQNGLITCYQQKYSFRVGYLYNNIYKGRFEDKFNGLESTPSDIQLCLNASVLTINFYNRLDIYGILGTSNLQIDQMIYTDRRLAFGAGFKTILLKMRCFDFSFDGKYFQTNQKPQYFVVDKNVFPLASSFEQKLEEYQASLALSYRTNFLIPYIGSTYLYSSISPNPKVGFLTLPGGSSLLFETNDSITRKKWGMVLGISVINRKNQANINIEARVFDQNAFAFLGTIRF
jgi:hypothetical protein